MPLLDLRELIAFAPNETDPNSTKINGVNFNLTALNHFNYTFYDNGTLSNGSNCVLSFAAYKPTLLFNGTFINGTTCYAPIEGLETRGGVGIAFASMFAVTILLCIVNLRKHGKRFLPAHKRFSLVGRRWQWYWLVFLGTVSLISCLMSIDVDRYFLQDLPLILQSIFYHLMLPLLLASLWEGVRHWGSWLERQIYDRDPFAFDADTTREKHELYLPLAFYFFGFFNFFLTVPRSWTRVPMQSSPEQTANKAMPASTDARFKAASIIAIPCLAIICYYIYHIFYWYKQCPRGRNPIVFYTTTFPLKFTLVIILTAIKIGYNIASAFVWKVSPLKYDGDPGFIYGLGYTPVLLALIILNVWGYIDWNEDRVIIRQRIARGQAADAELGIDQFKKPAWWRLIRMDFQHVSGNDADSRLLNMVKNVAGAGKRQNQDEDPERQQQAQTQSQPQQPHPQHARADSDFEMTALYRDNSHDSGITSVPPYPSVDERPPPPAYSSQGGGAVVGLQQPQATRNVSNAESHFTTASNDTHASQASVQRVRSMLDV